jgi:catechol 2,3-dioxygenase-like lactoylglutathione lyase family enzyme
MLNSAKMIAFVATADAARSRAFYEGVLGLATTLEDQFAIVLNANGVELRIQKVQTLTPQSHTQLGWSVKSLEEVLGHFVPKVWCSRAIPLSSKTR